MQRTILILKFRPFVSPWHSSIVSKRLKGIRDSSKLFHCRRYSFRTTNRCYEIRTAVTPNRAWNTVEVRAILSRCVTVRDLSRKRCKIVRPTISDHSNQKSYVLYLWRLVSSVLSSDKGLRQPQLWHQRQQTCWVLCREKVEGVRAATNSVPPPSYVRHDASPQLRWTSFHWGSAASDQWSRVRLSTETPKDVDWRLETIGVTHPVKNFWLRHWLSVVYGRHPPRR